MQFKLVLFVLATAILSACNPSFKSPEQCAEAIFVSLVHDDQAYLEAITITRDELDEIYKDLDFSAAGLDKAAVLDSAHKNMFEMLPGAMDGFRQGAVDHKINLGNASVSSVDIERSASDIFTGTETFLHQAEVWVYDDYNSFVLIIHHIKKLEKSNRWVMTYPEFEWKTYDEYYEYDYDEYEEAVDDDYDYYIDTTGYP